MTDTAERTIDVCVVGAGVAGAAVAQGLARQGLSVVLVERLDPMPDVLKAEKIDGEAAVSLIRLGFQPAVDAALTPLHSVSIFYRERKLGTLRLEMPEAGGYYHGLVNELRAHLDPRVDFRRGTKVESLEQHPDHVVVHTAGGACIACKLVIVATGDARHLLESLGATYEPQVPNQAFVAAFTFEGSLGDPLAPVDTQTYHHPVADGPIAYTSLFRLGDSLRANIFCPGPISDTWQRDLKQRPLEALSQHNRLLASASRSWRPTSPVMIRKVQVARLTPPSLSRVVVLGDAAHTIDPSGAGGLTFSLLEAELLLNVYIPRWLESEDIQPQAIAEFYNDPRHQQAVSNYFGRGEYVYALNHDNSLRGAARRLIFFLRTIQASRRGSKSTPPPKPTEPMQVRAAAWRLPAPYLFE
ncbi:MAG: NAD(P)/FAD-dependent oxidoreductase [Chloroflexia bacterium]